MIFTIPGPPFGKERPKFTDHAYTPGKTKAYEEIVAWAYKQARGQTFDGPVQMYIMAYYAIPQSASKRKRAAMIDGDILPTKRPDLDNIGKVILDGLNGRAFKDDAQVVTLCIMKLYAEKPRVVVEITGETAEQREARKKAVEEYNSRHLEELEVW